MKANVVERTFNIKSEEMAALLMIQVLINRIVETGTVDNDTKEELEELLPYLDDIVFQIE